MGSISRRQFFQRSAATVSCAWLANRSARGDEPVRLFNGKDLTGLYSWLRNSKYEDPLKVFTVEDGMLRITAAKEGAEQASKRQPVRRPAARKGTKGTLGAA